MYQFNNRFNKTSKSRTGAAKIDKRGGGLIFIYSCEHEYMRISPHHTPLPHLSIFRSTISRILGFEKSKYFRKQIVNAHARVHFYTQYLDRIEHAIHCERILASLVCCTVTAKSFRNLTYMMLWRRTVNVRRI